LSSEIPLGGQASSFKSKGWLNVWLAIVPFFLSAIFYMSGLFAVLSPLPLLFFFSRAGWARLALAVFANVIVVYIATGTVNAALYFGAVGLVSLVFPYYLVIKRRRLESSVLLTVATVMLIAFILIGVAAAIQNVNLVSWFKTWVTDVTEALRVASPQNLSEVDFSSEEFRSRVVVEFPSLIGVFILVIVWINAVFFLRLNPMFMRQRLGIDIAFMRTWRNPDWFVWVVIASGVCLILDFPIAKEIALNLIKFFLAAYAIQGIAILGAFFDSWKVYGIFKAFAFIFAIVLMMPLLLALGFFDLWFDFRAKLRQS
jgi:hypothetical protein